MKPDTMPEILNLSEVARYLRVHPTTVARMVKARRIPRFKVGGVWRFSLADIEAWQAKGGSQG